MKKISAIVLCLILLLSVTSLALALEKSITPYVSADMVAGYLKLPGYYETNLYNYNASGSSLHDYSDGAFFAQLNSLELKLVTDVKVSESFSSFLVSQFELYKDMTNYDIDDDINGKDDGDKEYSTVSSAVANYGFIYNPGPVKVIFDAKGRDVMLGIEDAELLKLNVARRYATNSVDPDGDPKIYRYWDNELAKQLTMEIPYKKSRFVSVFSLETTPQGKAGDFVGGFGEVTLGSGKYAIGYQAKMVQDLGSGERQYVNEVKSPYWVLSTDYKFSDKIRLQADYSTRDENGEGYQVYFKPVAEMEYYLGTPFKITDQIHAKLNLNNYELDARFLNDKYWLGAAYNYKLLTVGTSYRNWAFTEEGSDAQADGHVTEIYGKYQFNQENKNFVKLFYRTDHSFGLYLVAFFQKEMSDVSDVLGR